MNIDTERFDIPAQDALPSDLLAGRVILVTGAGQGLGRAAALACAAHGATVALLGRKQAKLESAYDAIKSAGGAEPALVPLDLAQADEAAYERLAQVLRHSLGRLDGVVHCAAHFVPLGPLENQTVEQWERLLRVNLLAPFAITRACLPLLRDAPDSSVIFTSETHAIAPRAYWGGFAVSKAGLGALAAIWADELERQGRPRIHVVVPGPIATPQRRTSHPGEDPAKLRTADEAARVFVQLLGPAGPATASGKTLTL